MLQKKQLYCDRFECRHRLDLYRMTVESTPYMKAITVARMRNIEGEELSASVNLADFFSGYGGLSVGFAQAGKKEWRFVPGVERPPHTTTERIPMSILSTCYPHAYEQAPLSTPSLSTPSLSNPQILFGIYTCFL